MKKCITFLCYFSIQVLKEAGIECNYVTGGGTGTFHFEAETGVFTEVQPVSFVFLDQSYVSIFSIRSKI